MHQQKTAFENIEGKEEIAGNEQFLLFPQCFLLNQIIVPHLSIFLTSYFHLLLKFKSPKLALIHPSNLLLMQCFFSLHWQKQDHIIELWPSWVPVCVNLYLYSSFPHNPDFLTTLTKKKPLENIVGKGENAGNQHFLLFPQCFLCFQR